jgi:hypothetical protein
MEMGREMKTSSKMGEGSEMKDGDGCERETEMDIGARWRQRWRWQ